MVPVAVVADAAGAAGAAVCALPVEPEPNKQPTTATKAPNGASLFKKLARLLSDKTNADLSDEEMTLMSEIADFQKMNEIRARVDTTVKDSATAEALKPWYGQGNRIYRVYFDGAQMNLREDISETTGIGLGVHTVIYPDARGFACADGQKDVCAFFNRPDRTSFGCGESDHYTFFDGCFLQSLPQSGDFPGLADRVKDCVSKQEQALGVDYASEPQLAIGQNIAPLLKWR